MGVANGGRARRGTDTPSLSASRRDKADNRGPRDFHPCWVGAEALKAIVRKTYPLNIEGKNRDRVLDAIKHDIRKYVKRQRRVALPEGVDFWDFDCKFGTSKDDATPVHFGELMGLIDGVAKEGGAAFYVELLAKNGHRKAKLAGSTDNAPAEQP